MTTRLLISVREAGEAVTARQWGASLIDVKEPSRGPLGRADDATLGAVLNQVAGACPVSAALGELKDGRPLPWRWEELAYLKWGLAGCAGRDWQSVLAPLRQRVGSRAVVVAYADARVADAPPVEEVVRHVRITRRPGTVLLIDTFDKTRAAEGTRSTLLDHLPLDTLARIVRDCHQDEVRVALAGSLGFEEIERLLPLRPDWVGVRGAVCEGGSRGATLSPARIRDLARILTQAITDSV
jgi:uncharacterized protein (UPF0264 family)